MSEEASDQEVQPNAAAIGWEQPAETLEEANDRTARLYQAVSALLGEGPHYNDPARQKADIALHPEKKAQYDAWAQDPTRAEGL